LPGGKPERRIGGDAPAPANDIIQPRGIRRERFGELIHTHVERLPAGLTSARRWWGMLQLAIGRPAACPDKGQEQNKTEDAGLPYTGLFTSRFLAGFATSTFKFVVKLTKGYIFALLISSPPKPNRSCFGLRRLI
jgi:hypothetical protein